jgi:hypothetical protein
MTETLNSLLPDVSVGTGVISQLDTAFSGVLTGNTDAMPLAQISTLVDLFSDGGGLDSPEKLLKQGADALSGIEQLFPADTAALIKAYSDELAKLENFIGSHPVIKLMELTSNFQTTADFAVTEMKDMMEQFKSLASMSKDDFDITQIFTSLQQLTGRIKSLMPAGSGESYSNGIIDFLKNIAEGLTGWISVPSVVNKTLNNLGLAEQYMSRIDLVAPHQQLNSGLAMLVAKLDNLDLSDSEQCAEVEARLLAVENGLSFLKEQFLFLSNQVGPIVLSVDVTKYAEALGAFVSGLDKVLSNQNLTSLSSNFDIGTLVNKVHSAFQEVNLSEFATKIKNLLEQLDPLLDELDPSVVTEPMTAQLEEVGQYLDKLEEAKIAITIEVRKCFETIVQQIDRVDLLAVKSTIETALNGFRNTVVSEVAEAVTAISDGFSSVINALQSALSGVAALIEDPVKTTLQGGIAQIKGALEQLDILNALETAEAELSNACEQLKQLDFATAVDPVLEEINDAKEKLAQIDISVLNDFLKISLKGALEIFKGIDFEVDISGALVGRFNEVKELYRQLITDIKEKVESALSVISSFDPKILLASADTPFETLVEAMSKIKPSELLSPLVEAYESCIEALEPFDPAALLAPLNSVIDGLFEKLDELKPSRLLAPLQERIDQTFEVLDKLDIDAVIDGLKQQCLSSLSGIQGVPMADLLGNTAQINALGSGSLFSNLDTQKIQDFFEQKVLAPLNAFLTALDVNVLFPMFRRLQSGIDILSPTNLLERPGSLLQSIQKVLAQLPLTDAVTQLQMKWQSATQAAASLEVSANPSFHASLSLRIPNLSPIDQLSAVTASIGYLQTRVGQSTSALLSLQDNLSDTLGDVFSVLDGIIPDFAKAPDAASASETFDAELAASIPTDLSTKVSEIIAKIKQMFESFQLSDLFPKLQALSTKFRQKMESFTDLNVLFAPLQDLVDQFKDKVKSFVDLSFFIEQLDEVYNTVTDKLSTLSPAEWTQDLSAVYLELMSALQGLNFGAMGQQLDQTYNDRVLSLLETLRPTTALLPPLEALFLEVDSIVQEIKVDDIFEALIALLDTLFEQLESELKRTGEAFKQMISAVPV